VTENGNNLLTIPEACEVLRCSETTVKRLLREGALTRIRHPGMRRTFLDREELQVFLAGETSRGEEPLVDDVAPPEPELSLSSSVLLAERYRMALEAILCLGPAYDAWEISARIAKGALDGETLPQMTLPQTDHGEGA
jgi:excisionase family DNA binding protein